MSTQATAITTTMPLAVFQPSISTAPDQSVNLPIEALALTEAMNNQAIAELTKAVESFKTLLGSVQKTLESTLEENLMRKNRIIQQETTSSEDTRLHIAEMRTSIQSITELSQSINQLTDDVRLSNDIITIQESRLRELTTPTPRPVISSSEQQWLAFFDKF